MTDHRNSWNNGLDSKSPRKASEYLQDSLLHELEQYQDSGA
jgi:hypothetical protein